MANPEQTALDRLNADLDALATSAPARPDAAAGRAAVDTDLPTVFRHLRQLDARRTADGNLADRIWDELMNETALADGRTEAVSVDAIPTQSNGRAAPQPWRASSPRPRPGSGRMGSPPAQVAAALLLTAAVLAVFVVVGRYRLAPEPSRVAAPIVGNPGTLLLATTLARDELPPRAPVRFVLAHGTVQPGAETNLRPSYAACCPGTFIDYVVKGTYALRIDGPLRVIRAGGETETIPANTEVTLAAGDAAIHRFEDGWASRNPGSSTTEVLDVLLVANDLPDNPAGLDIGDYEDVFPTAIVPEGPLRVELRQAAVTPGSSVYPAPQPGDHQAVVAGPGEPSLGLMNDGSVRVLGRGQVLTPEPATVFVLTLRPEAGAASQDDGSEVLLETVLGEDRGDGPLDLAFWRGAIAPGAAVNSPPDWAGHAGREVELVVSGTLVVEADEPVRVMRAGAAGTEPETVPAGDPVTLVTGDAVEIPFGSPHTLRNEGDEPLELLGVLVLTEDEPVIASLTPATGYLIRNGYLTGVVPALHAPDGPLRLTLKRMAGAENAYPAQTVREDGTIEWRLLDFLASGTPQARAADGTVYVLTLDEAE